MVVSLLCQCGVILGRIRGTEDDSFGFKAGTEEFVDLVEMGVIGLSKVTRLALQNAASIAGLMLTTEALIADIEENKAADAPPGGGDMGAMY